VNEADVSRQSSACFDVYSRLFERIHIFIIRRFHASVPLLQVGGEKFGIARVNSCFSSAG
jgi:hypothetical protein